jgi:hypothetical protein
MENAATSARVTLVMTVRERHRLTLLSVEDILARATVPFRLILAHGGLPGWLEQGLKPHVDAGRLELRHFPGLQWPQHLRQAVIGEVATEYVAFVDNDITVSPGWLEHLLACADETGGVVGPVYLWGDGKAPPKIHMAGGTLLERQVEGGRVLAEVHGHIDADPVAVLPKLARTRCDFVEFHCMLMPTVLAKAGVFDPDIVSVHEHIDTCLAAKREGHGTWLEPAARVTYLAHAPQTLEDLPTMRSRWDGAASEASIAAFCRKWDVIPDDRSFGGVRGYVHDLRWANDPLHPGSRHADLGEAMTREFLPQTRAALVDLAIARGYPAAQVALLGRACTVATLLFDGGYRPCGRPFVNHGIGAAGVLLRYDFCVEVVTEALLHAAYTHRRLPGPAVQEILGKVHPMLELRVREYTQRRGNPGNLPPPVSSIRDGEIAAVSAANEIDMRLAGEYDYSGRPAEIGAEQAARLGQFLELIGVPGMAVTLKESLAQRRAVPKELVTHLSVSYRLGPGNTLVRMAAGAAESSASAV